ncbi:MAG: gliding motility lipoprotein GldH [Bacteroidia bacterium]
MLHVLRILLIISLGVLSSCDDELVYEENRSFTDKQWLESDKQSFEVNITDTLQACDFYFNLRHGEDYPYSNLYVFMKTEFPNGEAAKDTMEFILQNNQGKWNGSGLGDLRDNQILFKKNLRFPLKGKFVFTLEQAMREKSLSQITEVGLRIEKASAN